MLKGVMVTKITEINIRDPYILPHDGNYYLYGTRSETCWGEADGFDCYVSDDFENWDGPTEIFHRPDGFSANQNYWAPECIYLDNEFYLVTTFGFSDRKKGIYVLKSENPTGPFELYSERITPENWSCIDGTVYFHESRPYLIFSHSFEDSPNGDMCILEMSGDLKNAIGEPKLLFSAAEAKWAMPVPFAKAEFGMDGDVYFTDGPSLMKMSDGKLYMTWSSWSECGYAVGVAVSESGDPCGEWKQLDTPLFPENGGHGMLFKDTDNIKFTLHFPNDKYKERPIIRKVFLNDGKLILEEE